MLSPEFANDSNEVTFTFPRDGQKSGNQNVKDEVQNFHFDGVLDMLTQQETVFNVIAKDVFAFLNC